jgi:uncharacterized HAD superfamily protein
MSRQVIAVDIDDVLADQAEAFLAFSNKMWGTTFGVHDYTEHWMDLWGVDLEETQARSDLYHESGTISTFRHKAEALPVLRRLKQNYSLVIVTSRRRRIKDETVAWIDRHFPDIFDDIHFAGFFDDLDTKRWHMTKADIVSDLGANFLIDDQLKHCVATAEAGINTVLFGDYRWNQTPELPQGVTRCNSWGEVEQYFDGRKLQA